MRSLTFRWCVAMMATAALTAYGADVPRPEHPNPQMMREAWMNLNGQWEFLETDDDAASFLGAAVYPDIITVPFCRESELSGLARRGFVRNVWYRRAVEVPAAWSGMRIRLHLGACDWRTTAYVNDVSVGAHTGGSAAFAFDITNALTPGSNTLVIHAFDDTRSGLQALGKQSSQEESHGCHYTRTTGLWQTVWLEAVPNTYIERYRVTPDLEQGAAKMQVVVNGPSEGLSIVATARVDGNAVARARGMAAGAEAAFDLAIPDARPWSVSDPFLYDLTLNLMSGDKLVDAVSGYFGMRSVEIKGRAILINGEPVFQRLVLDQGFYSDGIWTAPSEEALKRDILLSQAAGFNGARLHQKVFEPRFLYWADKLGYLIWGEFPNWGLDYANKASHPPVLSEWEEIVHRDYNHPSIIGWCPFNETPPAALPLQAKVVDLTKRLDPSRPVLETSGWTHGYPSPVLLDAHDYDQNPESFGRRWSPESFESPLPQRYADNQTRNLPFFISEYGGIGWNLDEKAWGYGNTPESVEAFYARYEGLTKVLRDNRYMFGFCYTQLTDIEQEQNGVYTYQREPKFDIAPIRASNIQPAAYESNPPTEAAPAEMNWMVLLGAQPDGDLAAAWRYTRERPAHNWMEPDFDAAGWNEGKGAFGNKDGFNRFIQTPWRSENIWLRAIFSYDGAAFDKALLVIHYDDNTTVYLNGKTIFSRERWNDAYEGVDVTDAVRAAIREGENHIAVHTWQSHGGQFIDMALLTAKMP